ncbi:MAG: YdcF family protein [Desulfobulbaceae bacterium]|nr:YdcF family protein [Desulfobulbaceae bacterium]
MMHSVFFWTSKLAWLLLSPDNILVALLLLTWFLLHRGGSKRLAKRLLTLITAGCLLIALLPVGEWLLFPLETRFPTNPALPKKIDGIVVLGGAEDPNLSSLWQQVELGDGAERYLAFMALSRRFPDARLIFTGGSGSMLDQQHKAADVAATLFHETGLNTSRIIFERESRNTYENAVFSKKIAMPKPGENWLLITTAWHMPRSMGIFNRAGWPMLPYPVDHRTAPGNLLRCELAFAGHLDALRIAIKEWLGLAAYRLTGKTTAFLPGPETRATVSNP